MAHAITRTAPTRVAHAAEGWIARLRQRLEAYRMYRQTVRELSMLTDRDLNDLGIHRLQIPEVAKECVYGR